MSLNEYNNLMENVKILKNPKYFIELSIYSYATNKTRKRHRKNDRRIGENEKMNIVFTTKVFK